MKVIAKTIGAINLIDPQTREFLTEVPSVVFWTQFKEARTGKGQIKILVSDLPDAADDADFQEFLKDAEDEELAVASFVSQFEEKPEPKQKPKKQKAEK